MKSRNLIKGGIIVCAICVLGALSMGAGAQEKEPDSSRIQANLGTAFTYQGILNDKGKPATGNYDLQFTLYDVHEGGSPLAGTSPLTLVNVSVTQGLFKVQLDFGNIYSSLQLYLEIGVRPGGSGDAFTILTPRQTITPVPQSCYAIKADNAINAQSVPWSGVTNKPANLNLRRIYVPANSMNYTPGSTITMHEKGLKWPNTTQLAGFGIPKPPDWDTSTPITVTLYFALYQTSAPGFCQWRLQTGGSHLNLSPDYPDSGWDQIYYSATEDASLLAYGNAGSRFYLMKSQSWTSKWSSTYGTWYFGSGVTTGTTLIGNAMWYFYFRRGCSVPNNETYTGDMYVVGADVTYQATQ